MEIHIQMAQQQHRSVTGKLVLVLSGPGESFDERGTLQLLFHSGVCVDAALFAGLVPQQPAEAESVWWIPTHSRSPF